MSIRDSFFYVDTISASSTLRRSLLSIRHLLLLFFVFTLILILSIAIPPLTVFLINFLWFLNLVFINRLPVAFPTLPIFHPISLTSFFCFYINPHLVDNYTPDNLLSFKFSLGFLQFDIYQQTIIYLLRPSAIHSFASM